MALGIGDTLRDARRRQNRSLGDAASQTRIRESHLAALEQEEFDALGGDVYVKGFLRSYAKYLGVDPEPLVDVYRTTVQRDSDLSLLAARPAGATRTARGPRSGIVVALVGVVLVILAVIGSRGGEEVQPVSAPGPATSPTAGAQAAAPQAGATATVDSPAPQPTASPQPPVPFGPVEAVVAVAGGPSYLRTEQGLPTFDGELADGQSRPFSGNPVLQLRLGNAGVVSLVVDGQDQGPLGRPGQVVVVTCAPGQTACAIEEITP